MKTREIAIPEDSEIEQASNEQGLTDVLRYIHGEIKMLEETKTKVKKKLAEMNKAAWEASKAK